MVAPTGLYKVRGSRAEGGEIADGGRALLAPAEIKRNDIVGATFGRPLVAQCILRKQRGYALIIDERKRERAAGSFHHFVVPLPLGGRLLPTRRRQTKGERRMFLCEGSLVQRELPTKSGEGL